MMDISIQYVKKIYLENSVTKLPNCYTRDIVVITEKGEKVRLVLFADIPHKLDVIDIDDAFLQSS